MPERLDLRAVAASPISVDKDAGVIRGCAVITAGKTKPSVNGGVAMLVDDTTLRQVASAINAKPTKVRLTHVEFEGVGDDIRHRVAWIENARVAGNAVRADVRFLSPTDPEAVRVLAIADEDPTALGLSIVTYKFEAQGPDMRLRVQSLEAVDIVSVPAANPAGLLSAKEQHMDFTDAQLTIMNEMGMESDADPAAFYETLDEEQKAKVDAAKDGESSTETEKEGGASVMTSAERERAHGIVLAAQVGGLSLQDVGQYINDPKATSATVLSAIRTQRAKDWKPIPMSTTVLTENQDTLVPALTDALTDALAMRLGARLKKAHPRHVEFASRPLVEQGRTWLGSLGMHNTMSMTPSQVADAMMRSKVLAMSQSTSDFPRLLADAMGKSLRTMYEEYPSTWGMWAGRRTHPDFKDIKVSQLHSLPTPVLLPEGEETSYVTLGESREVYRLATYSIGTQLTRQAIINDDLSAFDRLPAMAGGACRRLEDDLCYQVLTTNAPMEDDVNLFDAAHGNTGTGALGNTTLSSGRKKMAVQTDNKGSILNLRPSHLIVPVNLEDTARALIAATEVRRTGTAEETYTTNTYSFISALQVTSDPRLDANSTAQWYLAADPRVVDTVELAFLQGEEAPVVLEEEDFDTDVKKFRVRHNVAGKAIDWRGLYRSSGQ